MGGGGGRGGGGGGGGGRERAKSTPVDTRESAIRGGAPSRPAPAPSRPAPAPSRPSPAEKFGVTARPVSTVAPSKPAPSQPVAVDARETAIAKAAKAAPTPKPAPKPAPSKVAEKEYTIGPKRTRAGMTPAPVDARERAIAGKTEPAPTVMVSSPEERARIKAYEEITKRGETDPTIGPAKVIGTATRTKMKEELLKGGTPVVERIGGKDVTVGVVGEGFFGETAYTGRPGFDPIAARAAGEAPATRDEVTPAVTPEVTPEVVPDESVLGAAATTARERRRTRTRRAGQAGTILEGFGALYK